jgi:hypothetical protein
MTLQRRVCFPLLLGACVTLTAPAAGAFTGTGSSRPAGSPANARIADDKPSPLQPVICALKADAEGCKKTEPPK